LEKLVSGSRGEAKHKSQPELKSRWIYASHFAGEEDADDVEERKTLKCLRERLR